MSFSIKDAFKGYEVRNTYNYSVIDKKRVFYKLTNTCEVLDIENEINRSFKYPNVYEPKAIISGWKESNLPIITADDPSSIDFAIWGLLPENYDDNWSTFQSYTNTLNTNIDDNNLNEEIYSNSLDKRRCLIVVNGFFTSKLKDGRLQAHHVHLENHNPFCIAGIFNKINDGFLTCSLLVTNTGLDYSHVPNLGKQKPLIFKKKDYGKWLSNEFTIKDLKSLIESHDRYEFMSHPIEGHYYENSRMYDRIVNSNQYQSIMHVARD